MNLSLSLTPQVSLGFVKRFLWHSPLHFYSSLAISPSLDYFGPPCLIPSPPLHILHRPFTRYVFIFHPRRPDLFIFRVSCRIRRVTLPTCAPAWCICSLRHFSIQTHRPVWVAAVITTRNVLFSSPFVLPSVTCFFFSPSLLRFNLALCFIPLSLYP